jgi:nitrogen fixation protein NifU and related proteins
MNLTEIYRQVVLEHSRQPRHKSQLLSATHRQKGVNPSCGDELELFLEIENNQIVKATFMGIGCAISQASASMLTVLLEGQSVSNALALAADFHAMMRGSSPTDALGDAAAMQGVSKLHARVKCATLAWQTLEVILKEFELITQPTTGNALVTSDS